jgi:type I restriction enzyme S subunit
MNADRLFAHYEKIVDAPDAIARLRRFILDLAIRGKLVPQDPNDEPASAALARIKVRGLSDGAFPLPMSWVWVEVDSIADARLGKMLDKAKNKGIPRPYLRNLNVRWFDFDLSDLLEMPFEDSELAEFTLRSGDVLICEGGEPGRAAVWDERVEGIYFQKAIHRVRFAPVVDPYYFVDALKASAEDGRLSASFTGAGIKHFTGKGLAAYRFPLSPLAEQLRIVAKVDELMALCDRLEAARITREVTRDRLAAASLARLNAPDPETFQADTRFALDALPALTARPNQIKQLRQTILNLAVRGKLVQQDPKDEPAAQLLKRTASPPKPARYEKRSPELIAGDCGLSINDPGTQLPKGWLWVPLVKIARLESGHTPSRNRPDWWGGDVPWIGLVDARLHNNGTIYKTIQTTNEQGLANSAARLLPKGTVCFSRTASVGYVVIMGRAMATSQDFVNWVPTDAISSSWLQLVMIAERPAIDRFSKGAVHQTVYYPAWLSMHIALPPLAEQRRIVAKVGELMAMCDRMEAGLTAAAHNRRCLLDALLAEALASADARELEAAE